MQRPRRNKAGAYYTPKETQDSKRELGMLALAARQKARIYAPVKGEVELIASIALKHGGDLDNGVKTILDALEGVLFENDRQICRIDAERSIGQTHIAVEWE